MRQAIHPLAPTSVQLMGTFAVLAILLGSGAVAYAWDDGGGAGCGGPHHDGCTTVGGIFWTAPLQATPSAPNAKCTISIDADSDTATEVAINLAPGQSCVFGAGLKNTEDRIVAISESTTTWQPKVCSQFAFTDNVHPPPHPSSVASDQTFPFQGTLSLSSSAGNACEGSFAIFHALIIATPI